MNGRRAGQQAVAAFRGLLDAHESRDSHVVVRVRSQLAGALVAAADGILGTGLRLGHPSQAVATIALADRHAEMQAETPVDTLELLVAVAFPREAGNDHGTPALHQDVTYLRHQRFDCGMRELPSGHIERLDIRSRRKNHVERIQVPGIETIDETLFSSDGSAGPGAGVIDVFAMYIGHGIFQKIRVAHRAWVAA